MPAATSSAASRRRGPSGTTATATRSASPGSAATTRRGARSAACATWRTGWPDRRTCSRRRGPLASVNFVTAHDGFTLHDLVSYNRKHNEANGEDNRDGTDNNHSWNGGVEGSTDDAEVLALRRRMMRSLLTTLLVSTGVPMLTAGDEMRSHPGRQQQRLLHRRRVVVAVVGPRTVAAGPARVDPGTARAAPRQPGAAPRRVLRGAPGARRRHQGPRVVRHRRPGDDARAVVLPRPAGARPLPVGQGLRRWQAGPLTARAAQLRPGGGRRTAARTAVGLGVRRAARHQHRATGPGADLGARRDRPACAPTASRCSPPTAADTATRTGGPGAGRGRPWRVACRRSRCGAGRPPA